MCIQTNTKDGFELVTDSQYVNNKTNLFATKMFYVYEDDNGLTKLLGGVSNYQYKLVKDKNDIRIPINNAKQKVYQYAYARSDNASLNTMCISSNMTLELGYHANLFTNTIDFVIVEKRVDKYRSIIIPIMFKEKDIQFMGDTEIVVKTFVIPKPDIVFKMFSRELNVKFKKDYIEIYEKLKKITRGYNKYV